MCAHCLSVAETAAAAVAFAAFALKPRAHRALAAMGVVGVPDPVAQDATTVQFLRALQLDPVAILGADVVVGADAWRPQVAPRVNAARRSASARPIRSHSFATSQ